VEFGISIKSFFGYDFNTLGYFFTLGVIRIFDAYDGKNLSVNFL